MNGNNKLVTCMLLVLALLTAACGNTADNKKGNDAGNTPAQVEEANAVPAAETPSDTYVPQTIVDASGAELEFTEPVSKIACVVTGRTDEAKACRMD